MSDNEHPAVITHQASPVKRRFKPYKKVNEKLIINDENDPDRAIRDLYIELELGSIEGLDRRRQIEVMEAELEVAKARVAMAKAEHLQVGAKYSTLGREMWLHIGRLAEFDDRLKWRFDRDKTPEDLEFLVLVRTIDADDERELQLKAFSRMLAEHMGTEEAVERALRKDKAAERPGHYL